MANLNENRVHCSTVRCTRWTRYRAFGDHVTSATTWIARLSTTAAFSAATWTPAIYAYGDAQNRIIFSATCIGPTRAEIGTSYSILTLLLGHLFFWLDIILLRKYESYATENKISFVTKNGIKLMKILLDCQQSNFARIIFSCILLNAFSFVSACLRDLASILDPSNIILTVIGVEIIIGNCLPEVRKTLLNFTNWGEKFFYNGQWRKLPYVLLYL